LLQGRPAEIDLARPSALAASTPLKTEARSFAPRRALLTPNGQPTRGPQGEGTAPGWAGYVLQGQQYTSASGTWVVPRVSYAAASGSPPIEYSSTWVGIDGNTDQKLVQLGTGQDISSSGTSSYYAWYLFYTNLQTPETRLDPTEYPVSPGDTITATIQCDLPCSAAAQQTWRLTMHNSTKNWTWPPQPGQAFQYQSTLASVEWIMEATTVGGTIQTPPAYGSVSFSNVTANGNNPNLSFLDDAVTMVDNSGNPIAIASQPTGGNSFVVHQIGVPPSLSLPNQPTHAYCTSGTDFGQLNAPGQYNAQGTLQGSMQVDYYRFYTSQYTFITAFPGIKPIRYSYQIVDDLNGAAYDPDVVNGFQLSLDPGYYCLKIFNSQVPGNNPYNFQISAQNAGVPPSQNKAAPIPLSQDDLGNLSQNGYHQKSRYIYFNSAPAVGVPTSPPPVVLTPGHQYVLRDWVGPANQVQWYTFALDSTRNISLHFQNLYLGATLALERLDGTVVGAAVYDNASSLGPLLPSQSFNGSLPAGTYLIGIAFQGIGAPGTTFALSLTAM
jgi:hypothetical protein